LLELFSQESEGLFSYEIIDPEADPVAAQDALPGMAILSFLWESGREGQFR
jgi:hypothetical protein